MQSIDMLRSDAFDSFQKQGWPDQKVETWRYIGIDPRLLDQAHRAHRPTGKEDLQALPEAPSRLVLVDGFFQSVTLCEAHRALGVYAGPLSGASHEVQRRALGVLNTAVPSSLHRLISWNLLSTEPVVVHIPAGPAADAVEPIHVVHVAARTGSPTPRLLILADEGAHAAVVEQFVAPEADLAESFPVAVTEADVAPRAELNHGTVHNLPRQVHSHHTVGARVREGGRFVHASALLSAGPTRQERFVHLCEPRGHSDVRMMLLGQGRAHHDVYTSTRHTAPKTTSNLQLRAALLQRSRASVIGHMWIDGDGHAADGAQEARGLLLGKKARMDAIPELEIVHDVVKASHAVGISQLDEEQLWYARCRGLDRAAAEKLLIMGFFDPIVAEIPGEALRELVTGELDHALNQRAS